MLSSFIIFVWSVFHKNSRFLIKRLNLRRTYSMYIYPGYISITAINFEYEMLFNTEFSRKFSCLIKKNGIQLEDV